MGAGYPAPVQETRMKGEPGQGLRLCPYCALMPQWGLQLLGRPQGRGELRWQAGSTCNRGSLTTDAERAKAPGQD